MAGEVKKVYVSRDPDSQLRSFETVELVFDAAKSVTVGDILKNPTVVEELDVPSDLSKMNVFVDGIAATMQRVLKDGEMVLIKTAMAKDNG